tara:strand:+ start:193 stop:465 length:273 start_codon:yes stop_codon:yes gene_type:complete
LVSNFTRLKRIEEEIKINNKLLSSLNYSDKLKQIQYSISENNRVVAQILRILTPDANPGGNPDYSDYKPSRDNRIEHYTPELMERNVENI